MTTASDEIRFDAPTERIVDYALGPDAASPPDAAIEALTDRLIDAVGCAVAAMDAGPCVAARALAATAQGNPGASALGLATPSTPELAAFANGCHVRYLDFNDTYHTEGGGHPSDMLPALLAAIEITGGSGRDLFVGLHVAYEVFAALADAVPMRDHGWDYGGFMSIATAAGVARVLELDPVSASNAVSLAITPSLPMFVTRTGELSNWKGCASALAASSALFACRLARAGMTGPPQPFTGKFGLWDQATGPFGLEQLGRPVAGRTAVERTNCKLHPADYETQIPSEVFTGLHNAGVTADDIELIRVSTYFVAWDLIGGGQGDHAEKWDPKRRETADHSLPYLISVALTDGVVSADSFTPQRISDPTLRPLMQRIVVSEDPAITRNWTIAPAYEFDITFRDGSERHIRVDHPLGHFNRPLTREQVETKFAANVSPFVTSREATSLLERLRYLPEARSLDSLTAVLRSIEPHARR